jgi:hypothetical protein
VRTVLHQAVVAVVVDGRDAELLVIVVGEFTMAAVLVDDWAQN